MIKIHNGLEQLRKAYEHDDGEKTAGTATASRKRITPPLPENDLRLLSFFNPVYHYCLAEYLFLLYFVLYCINNLFFLYPLVFL